MTLKPSAMNKLFLTALILWGFWGCKKEDPSPTGPSSQPAANDSFLVKVVVAPADSAYTSCGPNSSNGIMLGAVRGSDSTSLYNINLSGEPVFKSYQFYSNEDTVIFWGSMTRQNFSCSGTASSNRYRFYLDGQLKMDTISPYFLMDFKLSK